MCALIVFRDTNGQLASVTGSNIETCFIHGSICAERSAIPKMRERGFTKVEKLFLCSDGDGFITPGIMCREFIAELAGQELPIYLTGGETMKDGALVTCGVRIEPFGRLYPFPPVYRGVERNNVLAFAKDLARRAEPWRGASACAGVRGLAEMLEAVLHGTAKDCKDMLHSIRYAAGVLFADGSFQVAHETKALEYGGTIDPVSKLSIFIDRAAESGLAATHVVMMDQFGVCHALMAKGRCFLHENGFGRVRVLLHDPTTLRLTFVSASELLPESPDIEELLGATAAKLGETAVARTMDLSAPHVPAVRITDVLAGKASGAGAKATPASGSGPATGWSARMSLAAAGIAALSLATAAAFLVRRRRQ